MKPRIRTAAAADEQRIRALFLDMLRTIFRTNDVKGYEDGYLDKYWRGGEDRIFVAEAGEVVGFLSAEVYHEPEAYLYVDDFAVDPAWRNRGLGSGLMEAAEAYAKELGIPAVLLHVEKTNLDAVRLYKRRGYSVFREDGSRYLMVRELP